MGLREGALQPDDRKRLRMVRAEPAVGRGRRTSVSTSSFQDASINWRAASQVGVLHKKSQHKRVKYPWQNVRFFPRKTFDEYADAAVPAIKLIKKLEAGNTDIPEGQQSNYYLFIII